MKTVQKIKNDLGDEFTEQIVSMDHNVPKNYDQEFSIHIVCRPSVTEDQKLELNQELREEIEEMSEKCDIAHKGFHIHVTLEIPDDILGIEADKMELQT